MILIDTGPLVAIFDPRDEHHKECRRLFASIRGPLYTTVPVITETFHMLPPGAQRGKRFTAFLRSGNATIWNLDEEALHRAFDLMKQYADHPMDFADASLIVAAEQLSARTIFTLDRKDFRSYRAQRGHKREALKILGES